MIDLSKYDITEGFVLPQGASLEYLKWVAEQVFEQAMQKGALGIDAESAGKTFEDLVVLAQTIVDKDWEWVKFYEQPMSASEIGVKEMIEKE